MRRLVTPALLLVLLASTARAGGIDLSWDDCGSHGVPFKSFLCNSNAGTEVLVASFVAPVAMPQLVGVAGTLDIMVDGPALSPWWDFTPTGCRANRLNVNADFVSGPIACADPWQGQAAGALNELIGPFGPNTARIRVAVAVPQTSAFAADDTTEYYAFKVLLSRAKSVGLGSCAGCDLGACLILGSMQLAQPAGVGDYTVTNTIHRNDAYWQCPGFTATDTPGLCVLTCPTPAERHTWGEIKHLYH